MGLRSLCADAAANVREADAWGLSDIFIDLCDAGCVKMNDSSGTEGEDVASDGGSDSEYDSDGFELPRKKAPAGRGRVTPHLSSEID